MLSADLASRATHSCLCPSLCGVKQNNRCVFYYNPLTVKNRYNHISIKKKKKFHVLWHKIATMGTSYLKSDYQVFRKSKFALPAQDNNRVVLQNTEGVVVFDATKQRICKNQKRCRVTWPTDKLCQRPRIQKADLFTATRIRGSHHGDTPTELVFAFVSIVFCMWWVSQPPSPSAKGRWRMVMVLRDGNLLNLSTVSGRDLWHLGHTDFGLGWAMQPGRYKFKYNLPRAVHHLCCKISDCPWHASFCQGVAEIKKKKMVPWISREHLNYSHIHWDTTSLSNLLSCLPVTWGIYLFFLLNVLKFPEFISGLKLCIQKRLYLC